MDFAAVLKQVTALLQHQGRVSYRALKLRFQLDEELLAGITDELIDAQRLARDEDGKVLVWIGEGGKGETAKKEKGDEEVVSSQAPVLSSLRSSTPQTSNAERRQLTVMFCDLVDSTALSTRLDPEDLREVIRRYQDTCTEVIQRFDGTIAQYLGDGLLVYFGYPQAHEDDAARAVRAGLAILPAMQTNALQVRIGIHTGPVVISEIGSAARRESLALGETPNIAARVQGQATPQTIVISAATQQLVHGLFACQELGARPLKGIATPLALYQVVSEAAAHSRFDVAIQRGLTPLVGREHEVGLLSERWARAKQAEGQVVLLSGEPGIGKSRLVQVLREHAERDRALRVEFRCSPYHQNSAFYPIIEQLQRLLAFAPQDSATDRLGKLEQMLTAYRFPQADTVPLLAALLSLPHPAHYPALTFSPQRQKQKTQEVLVAWLVEEAERHTLYCPWEDLHWADPSTLEVLTLFLQQVPTARLLTVLTFRPEFTPPWGAHSYLSQLSLSRLGRKHVETMVAKVTGGHALPTEVLQQIVSKTDGVPLFVEELTKSVVESVGTTGHVPLHALDIPATLQDSLMARLDRLGTAKEIAQLGAMLGREFTYKLLKAISSLNEDVLHQGLRQLVDAELVFQSGVPPHARYLFKHALIQDTAYQALLKSRRQQLHQHLARVLVEQFPDTAETQPELVARHYTEAGLVAQAIPYWQRAGERSVDRSAYIEGISHLNTGLELLATLPQTVERLYQELNLQTPLGLAYMATKGYGAVEVDAAYMRARELCRQVGETPQLAPVLYGLWILHLIRAELPSAYEAAEQLLHLGQHTHDPSLILEGHHGLGQVAFVMGDFAATREHMEQGITLSASRPSSPSVIRPVQDPGVMCRGFAAWSLWHLGYPDQALQRVHEALALAETLSHPFSFAYALFYALSLHEIRKESQLAHERAEALLAFASAHDFPYFVGVGRFRLGAMRVAQGQIEQGLTQMRQSMDTTLARGLEMLRPIFLIGLAASHGNIGQIEAGLALLTEAETIMNTTGQRLDEVRLYMLKGSLLLKAGGQKIEDAEECFRQALEAARRQRAKSLELQAAMRSARMWQQQGKRAEAHKVLSEVYNWFTEGFDTKDLQEAKALLDALAEDR